MDATWNDEAAGKLVEKRMNLAVTYADAWLHLIRAARFCGQVVTGDRAGGIDPKLVEETGSTCCRTSGSTCGRT